MKAAALDGDAIDPVGTREPCSERQEGREDERVRRILQERSRQLAGRGNSSQVVRVSVLTLEAGSETFALKVADAMEVAGMGLPTAVPRAVPALLGMVDRRGVLCRVYDLLALCGLTTGPSRSGSGHLVVLRAGGGRVGLRVDRATTIAELPAADLAPSGDGVPGMLGRHTRGGLNLLDPAAILSRVDGTSQHVV
ncbi:chemotaxis protein CheW [Geminicoccus roseus]|uniref:chemotaxis protein CheW n=1 Tax=Geminicoccus roseus TaxID=404900 RepID=UPI00040764A7|nr:chemotaxis protein CheW [Geminicoccus roseus]